MVELRVQIIGAKPERVSSLEPGEVRRGDILVIAEQERIAGVVVTDVGPTAVDLKRRHTALKVIRTIRAGDAQHVEAEVRNYIEAFRAESLSRIAGVCVQNKRGT